MLEPGVTVKMDSQLLVNGGKSSSPEEETHMEVGTQGGSKGKRCRTRNRG